MNIPDNSRVLLSALLAPRGGQSGGEIITETITTTQTKKPSAAATQLL